MLRSILYFKKKSKNMIFGSLVIFLSFCLGSLMPIDARKSFFIMLSLHSLIILFYAFSEINFIGGTEDASSFYNHSIERANNISSLNWSFDNLSNGHDFFKNIHALLQKYFGGPEKFLSYSTTFFAWSLSLLILSKIYLSISKNDLKGLIILIYLYSLTPGILIFHSLFLREVWLSLFVFCILYFSIIFKKNTQSLLKFSLILSIGVFSIFFHRYMVVIISMIIAIVMIYDCINKYSWYPFNNLKLLIYTGIFTLIIFILLNMNLQALNFINSNGFLGSIEKYTIGLVGGHGDGSPPARTSYGKIFDEDNIFSIIKVFFTYHFMPYPWRVTSIFDLAPLFENILRVVLVILYFINRIKISLNKRMILDMIFLMWFSIELIWSIGTINWGTAFRHHTVAYGLLVLASIAAYRDNTKHKRI